MPVPTLVSQLSTTANSNSPSGADSPSVIDDHQRAAYSFIAQHRDGTGFTQEATVASATTTDIGAATSFYVQVTGNTTITGFGTNYNGPRFVRFSGTPTLTHNATTLILPTGANITAAAGDRAILAPAGNPASGWQVVSYQRANGTTLSGVQPGPVTTSNLTMATRRALGRVSASTGDIEELTPAQLSTLATSKIQPISTSVGSNALTITLNPTAIDFRSTTLASGTVTTVDVPSAITLTVSPGSTLGTTNGILARLAILAINNAGTAELAIVNLAGGVNLNESGVISTTAEGGAGGADSVSTIYSTTSRSSVVYRLIGFIESTQTTAGTWAALPSLVNATSSPLAMWTSGYGKLWQDLTGSRSLGTGYTNSTGREIEVNVQIGNGAATPHVAIATVNGVTLFGSSYATSGSLTCAITFKVPPGGSYLANGNLGTPSLSTWNEYR